MAMALPAACLSEDQFTCSICLEVFTNPVSTPCGHSFCQACICSYWDRGGGGGRGAKTYQCPLCKETFRKRPELQINRTLKEITEHFKQVAEASAILNGGVGALDSPNANHLPPQLAPSQPSRAVELPEGIFAEMMKRFQRFPGSVVPPAADANPGDPQSSAGVNLQQALQGQNNERQDLPPPYLPPCRVSLSGPSDSGPHVPLCPVHLTGVELFCRTDNTGVCNICVETADHRGHNIVSAKREWLIKKSQLGITEVELKDLILEREKKVEEIQSSVQGIKAAAERETDGAVCAFTKLISSVECCQTEVLEVIEMSVQAAERRAQSLLKELEEEISELRRRSATLSQLALSEDYIDFLKTFPYVSTPPQTRSWSGVSVSSPLTSGGILRNVDPMMEQLQKEIKKLPELCKRSSTEPSVPRTNTKVKRVQEYAADITLDANTAHPRLIVSAGGKQVHCGERHQVLPDNPERFDRVVCVLAQQGFSSGRHYWEVEVGGKTDWDLGVASRSVHRKGKITVSPAHGYWFLSLRDRTDYAFRTEPSTSLTVSLRPSRIGIYVDCDKGLVSFYNVDAKVLIYTYTQSFSDTIHPFFSPCTNKSGRNEAPLVVCPVAVLD